VIGGRSPFNQFLHAIIREQESGVSLTVLSLLAQNDIDPWEEAERYALLPMAEAAMNLADLMVAAVGIPAEDFEADLIAVRLVVLLPQAATVPSEPRAGLLERFRRAAGKSRNDCR
jgi:hypothetical protein